MAFTLPLACPQHREGGISIAGEPSMTNTLYILETHSVFYMSQLVFLGLVHTNELFSACIWFQWFWWCWYSQIFLSAYLVSLIFVCAYHFYLVGVNTFYFSCGHLVEGFFFQLVFIGVIFMMWSEIISHLLESYLWICLSFLFTVLVSNSEWLLWTDSVWALEYCFIQCGRYQLPIWHAAVLSVLKITHNMLLSVRKCMLMFLMQIKDFGDTFYLNVCKCFTFRSGLTLFSVCSFYFLIFNVEGNPSIIFLIIHLWLIETRWMKRMSVHFYMCSAFPGT